jgi:flagellar basal body rod protein FlgG
MKRYTVFYISPDFWRIGEYEKNITKRRFDERYTRMGEFEAEGLDKLFGLLNQEGNPLASHQYGSVVTAAQHTSMSVGDVAMDQSTGVYHICQPIGWTALEINEAVA